MLDRLNYESSEIHQTQARTENKLLAQRKAIRAAMGVISNNFSMDIFPKKP